MTQAKFSEHIETLEDIVGHKLDEEIVELLAWYWERHQPSPVGRREHYSLARGIIVDASEAAAVRLPCL